GTAWLGAKAESGGRRLDNADDFFAIEIAAALARAIRVIPVLVDGARMPKASELPDSLKPLARRQAVEVRHAHFGHDAEAVVARMREALGGDAAGPRRWRVRAAIGAAAVAAMLLIGWSGYAFIEHMLTTVEQAAQRLEAELRAEEAKAAAEAEAKRKADEVERQRFAAFRTAGDKRVALVIGNSTYRSVARLPNASRDAAAIAKMFNDAGFASVDVQLDVSVSELKRAIRKFQPEADKADIAVVYYAGYGVEIRGTNYLIPVDARL